MKNRRQINLTNYLIRWRFDHPYPTTEDISELKQLKKILDDNKAKRRSNQYKKCSICKKEFIITPKIVIEYLRETGEDPDTRRAYRKTRKTCSNACRTALYRQNKNIKEFFTFLFL